MSHRALTEPEESGLINQYLQGQGSTELAVRYGTSRTTICNILKRNNIKRRDHSEARRASHPLNEGAFDDLSNPEVCYWVGFLLADGCIREPPGRITISLALGAKDINHVQAFTDFVGYSKVITSKGVGTSKYAAVTFYSLKIGGRLISLGIHPRKTSKEAVPTCLADNPDFWRGIVDGDGWITRHDTSNPILGVCGSFSVCSSFLTYAQGLTPTTATVRKIRGKRCHQVAIRGVHARRVIRELYYPGAIALGRKAERAFAATVNVVLYDRMLKRSAD